MPRRISVKASSESILNGPCAYHLTALEIDPEANFLVKATRDDFGGLEKANQSEVAADRGVTKARAKVAFFDEGLDDAVRTFDLRLQEVVGKNRDAPTYRKYFPQGGITPVVTASIEEETRLVGTILAQLETAPANAPERALLPELKAAHGTFQGALSELRQALQALADAYAVELEWRMKTARRFEINEGELIKKLGKGRRLRRFFLAHEREEDAEGDEGPPPPTATTA